MNRSIAKRLDKLETQKSAFRIVCLHEDEIEEAAKSKLRPSDVEVLPKILTSKVEDLLPRERAVLKRWNAARTAAIDEAAGDATIRTILSADDWNL